MATQLISKDEVDIIGLVPFGKKHAVRILIEDMKPGEMLHIEREDFNWKRKTPSSFCRKVSKNTGAKFRILKQHNKTGWVVGRVD
jgi:hypothetical protein